MLDVKEHATRRICDSLTPGEAERFTGDTWVVMDVCKGGWPYVDNWFDFAIFSHLLEDVRDPLTVCRELSRVAKRGYIEVPSRAREIYSKAWLFHLRAGLGRMPEV
ncbi:MAG: methyltransferase domain-containing protein, partial [Alphaproteobacteria bacterium]